MKTSKHASLKNMLVSLTVLCVFAQTSFFAIHSGVSNLIDSLVQNAFIGQLFHFTILLPLLGFIFIQLINYILLISWIWFIATLCGSFFKCSDFATYLLGLFFWMIMWVFLFALNSYFFSHSFFSEVIRNSLLVDDNIIYFIILFCGSILLIATLLAYGYSFWHKQHRLLGSVFLSIGLIAILLCLHDEWLIHRNTPNQNVKPNIILIGLDSLRPDFVNYFGIQSVHTPNIDRFLKNAVVFTDAYTPLARTFPAWVSILTAKYPKHSHARNNLVDQTPVLLNDNLAKRLQKAGYETIYATDEKRFSNITTDFGFDRLIGPPMGVNDFILGGLSDLPLTNLLINMPIGRLLFPYQYGNRAAAITYEPDSFLTLVKLALTKRTNKPLFLAIHFCVSHWPYTWARDHQHKNFTNKEQYQSSVEEVDQQLGELLAFLKKKKLLEHSLVVLLSDHGTALGLPFDRITARENYQGDVNKLKWMTLYHLSGATFSPRLDTSYGQGTDVLSLTQQHVILALQGAGFSHTVSHASSLMDIAPTLLDYLQLPPLQNIDGISQKNYLFSSDLSFPSRALIFESGYAIREIEKTHIDTNKVIQKSIGVYQINPKTALLTLYPLAEQTSLQDKQRAILLDNWLLARYPAQKVYKLVRDQNNTFVFKPFNIPAYFVLVNIRTKKWTIGFSSPLAKQAPLNKLINVFNQFYNTEIN